MQLVEQHMIRQSDSRFAAIDEAAFKAKNLYNLALYTQRQHFFDTGGYLQYVALYKALRDDPAYQALPRKISQQVLRLLDQNFRSFFRANEEWQKDPAKFKGRPHPPKYKDKQQGRCILVYTSQALSGPALRQGIIKPSGLGIEVQTRQSEVNQVRIVPHGDHYVVEVVYTVEPEPADLDFALVASIDLGVNTLAAVTSNKPGFQPLLINGRPLKSTNQFYNKRRAELQSRLPAGQKTSARIERLTTKRNLRVKHYLHMTSRRIIDHLVAEGLGTLVIGKNDGWKQEVNIGRRNNQTFVSIPHSQFIQMLSYKAELVGIRVILQEESYTSKTSFLDSETPQKHEPYAGRRIARGLFQTGDGRLINADVNASYQILVKAIPNAFAGHGIEAVVVQPVGLPTN